MLLSLIGCTTTSEFYSPDVVHSELVSIGSCGHRDAIFRREVAPGVVLEMHAYFVIFRIEDDRSFQLTKNLVRILDADSQLIRDIEITSISTGTFGMSSESKLYGIPETQYSVLGRVQGTGRYNSIKMGWGEWSRWKGKSDVFQLEHDPIPEFTEQDLFIQMPDFYANDTLINMEPIKFTWTKGSALTCVQ